MSKVLLMKVEKKNTESEQVFKQRLSLYKNAANSHNMMVWNTLTDSEKNNEFNTVRGCYNYTNFVMNNGTTFESSNVHQNSKYNPYFDSGFDLFQPNGAVQIRSGPNGETKSQELSIGTHLIGLGVKAAMYTFTENHLFDPEQQIDNKCSLFKRIFIYNHLSEIEFENNVLPQTPLFSPYNLVYKMHTEINMKNSNDFNNQRFKYDIIPTPYKLHPRSSIYKKSIRQANCTGIIDSGYRGEICAAVDCLGKDFGKQTDPLRTTLERDKRYFQLCSADLTPFYVVILKYNNEQLPSTSRGEGGFGSTGR